MSEERSTELPDALRGKAMARRGWPRSPELSSALLLLLTVAAVQSYGPQALTAAEQLARASLSSWEEIGPDAQLLRTPHLRAILGGAVVIWFAAVIAVGVQGGLCWRPTAIRPSFARLRGTALRPESGLMAIWSMIVSMARIIGLLGVGLVWLGWGYPAVMQGTAGADGAPGTDWLPRLFRGLTWVGTAWLAMGIIDFAVRRLMARRSLRVSDQELRETLRALSGNPEVRQLLREQRHKVQRRPSPEFDPP